MRYAKAALAIAVIMAAVSCANKTTPPEVAAISHGTTVLAAVNEFQKGVTRATDAKVLSVETGQKLTDHVATLRDKAGPLGEALKAYHSATSVDLKQIKASEAVQLIADMNGIISQILHVTLPAGALNELSKLVGSVITAVGDVQSEVAKGLGS